MRAARYRSFGGPIDIVDVAEPVVPDDGVVIRVEATGVCRSDWHAWKGHDPEIVLPHIPGHEYAGTVVEAGADAGGVAAGQRVVVPFVLSCGACPQCAAGEPQVCRDQLQPGFTLPGSFAEYVAVPRAAHNVIALPDHISFATAATLGCRYTTAWRAVIERGRLAGNEWCVVFGAGGVGLAAVQIGSAIGARMIAVDPDPAARERAAATGATATLPTADDLVTTIRDLTGGVNVTVDAIGDPSVAHAALGSLKPRGRHVQVGILAPPETATIPLNLVMGRELEILGSHGMAPAGFPKLFDLIAERRLDPAALITQRVTLTEGADHLAHMDKRTDGIVLIEDFR